MSAWRRWLRRPYDLRHACLSTWLNSGVDPTQVAEWAGNSVDVLLRVYAKCIAGRDEINRRRIEDALRDAELDDQDVGNDEETGAGNENGAEPADPIGNPGGRQARGLRLP